MRKKLSEQFLLEPNLFFFYFLKFVLEISVLYSSVIYITYIELDRNRKYQVFLSCQKDLKLVCNFYWCRKFPIHMAHLSISYVIMHPKKYARYILFHMVQNGQIIIFLTWTDCFSILLNQDIDKYSTFSMLPRDIGQQIFDDLVHSLLLNDVSLEAFWDCALQVFSETKYVVF